MSRKNASGYESEAASMFEEEDFDAAYIGGQPVVDEAAEEQEDANCLVEEDDDEEEVNEEQQEGAQQEDADNEGERVAGYKVHPAAAQFPLLEGTGFDELVESIRTHGQLVVVLTYKGQLLDGRNRARAVERLRQEGHGIVLNTRLWVPSDECQSPVAFIMAMNLHRRDLTDAQRAQIAAELVEMIAQERGAAQAASQIKPEEVRNPGGRNQHSKQRTADTKTLSPAEKKTRNKEKAARTTVGKIADAAGTTHYAASQAMKIKKEASPETIDEVKAGKKKPKDAVAELNAAKGKRPKTPKAAKPIDHPFKPSDDFERAALRVWTRLVEKELGVADKARGRQVMRAIFKAEEEAERKASATTKGGGK
jgi:hypothetical protein